nr:MAG TPA: Baseplate structural protein [Caudoviricetes sp.]
MNIIHCNQAGGFPLTTETLNFLQNTYKIFNAISGLTGDLVIVSGCQQVGNTISDGVVVIEGELYPFEGTTLGATVFIKEIQTPQTFEDGSSKNVYIQKVATFGNSTRTYPWSSFKRILNNQQIEQQTLSDDNSVLKRLEKLEERVRKTVPIGLVAIWDRPASEIPEGWVEHTEMQGVVPVGYKSTDSSFNTIGTVVGEKTEQIELRHLPNLKLDLEYQNGSGFEILGVGLRNITDWHRNGGQWGGGSSLPHWGKDNGSQLKTLLNGGEQPINNIQPSRIVKFIRFVGF